MCRWRKEKKDLKLLIIPCTIKGERGGIEGNQSSPPPHSELTRAR